MNDIMVHKPILGTNQWKVKFGDKVKRKLKVRTATKVKVFIIVSLIFSLYLNYYLLKTNYVFTCTAIFDGITQNWNLGHLESKNTCNDLIADRLNNLTH